MLKGSKSQAMGFCRSRQERLQLRPRAPKERTNASRPEGLYAEAIVRTVRYPLVVLDGDLRVQSANQAFFDAFGCPPEETTGCQLGELHQGAWDVPELRRLLRDVLSRDEAFDGFAVDFDFPSVGQRRVLLDARKLIQGEDSPELILLGLEDVTENQQTNGALLHDDSRIQLALEAGQLGSWELDLTTGSATRTLRHDQIFGYDQLLPGWSYADFMGHVLPEDREEVDRRFRAVSDSGQSWDFECRIRRPDGEVRWIEARGLPLKDAGRQITRLIGTVADITERKQADAHRETLIGELNHRVKNVLAAVMSIASQTWRRSGSLDEFRKAFEGRLFALSRAHDLLVEQDWTGAEMTQLARRTLEPYNMAERVVLDGPRLRLNPKAGVALVLILHELATNAVKYGALSSQGGRLEVAWRLEGSGNGDLIRLEWTETGGPPVKLPSHQGFGTSLIRRSASYELGGDATMEFREDGLRCRLIFPQQASTSVAPNGLSGERRLA